MKRFLTVIVWSFLFISLPLLAHAETFNWKGQAWSYGGNTSITNGTGDTLQFRKKSDWVSTVPSLSVSCAGQNTIVLSFKRLKSGSYGGENKKLVFKIYNASNASESIEFGLKPKSWDMVPYLKAKGIDITGTTTISTSNLSKEFSCSFTLSGGNLQYTFADITGSSSDFSDFTFGNWAFAGSKYENTDFELTNFSFGSSPPVGNKHAVTITSGDHGSATPTGEQQVNEGSELAITFTPDSGYIIDAVTVDGNPVDSGDLVAASGFAKKYTLTKVTAPHTVNATFTAHPPVTMKASVVGNGTISPSGDVSVAYNGSKQFTITPAEGHELSELRVNGRKVYSPSSPYTVDNVVTNGTIVATFAKKKYSISLPGYIYGGTVSPSGYIQVEHGADQKFTFTPNEGYVVSDVVIDGKSQGAIPSYTFTNVTAQHSVGVSFSKAPTTYTVTPQTPTNGTISPSSVVTVASGEDATFTFTPNAGYEVKQVLVNGTKVADKQNSYTIRNITENKRIAVEFTAQSSSSHTVTASSGANGTISPSGSVSVDDGTDKVFTFTPSSGYIIDTVTLDGSPVNSGDLVTTSGFTKKYTLSNITAPHSISVTFTKHPPLTVKASVVGNGTISPSGDVSVEYDGSRDFTYTPAEGYEFSELVVNDRKVYAPRNPYTMENVVANGTIVAKFIKKKYRITLPGYINGGTISPNGYLYVNHGEDQKITFTPNAGYAVSDVVIDGESQGAILSYTFVNVTATHSVSVTFARQDYAVTPQSPTHGTISPSSPVGVTSGGSATFTFTPDAGYEVKQVLVDGSKVAGKQNSYTLTNITANKTIAVEFALASSSNHTITASSSAGGAISPTGTVSVNDGSDQAFSITPDDGYLIDDVLVDGNSVGKKTNYTFTNVTKAHAIAVSFVKKSYSVTVQDSAHGSVTASTASVEHGQSVTLTVTPEAGYTLSSLLVNGVSTSVSGGKAVISNVVENITVKATFASAANDSDSDGLDDDWERTHFGDLSHDGTADTDNDGLTDKEEYRLGTAPKDADSDDDGMPDGWEVQFGLNPNLDDASGDKDNDGISNADEHSAGTEPNNPASKPGSPSLSSILVPVMKLLME